MGDLENAARRDCLDMAQHRQVKSTQMTLRLFTAVSLPDDIAERLEMLQCDVPGAQWRERDNLHLTLAFFGDVGVPIARELDEQLAEIHASRFEVSLESVGWFGRKAPTALWAGVAENKELRLLARRCEMVGRSLGLDMPRRPYKPHVTLAYCNGASLEAASAFQHAMREFRTEPFSVAQFELYSSRRTRGQNRYEEEATYPLSIA